MPWIAYALPVLPGQSDRLENWITELEPHIADYHELNHKGTVRRHFEWLQRSPQGDLRITVFEVDDPRALGRVFENTEYDLWWRSHVRDVHGFDPQDGGYELPRMIHSFEAT